MNQARVRSGMMFAAVPPSWMIPWTRQCGRQLLAPQPDRHEQHDHRVEGVPARSTGPTRRGPARPVNVDVDVLGRERRDLDVVAVARVVQERGVEALEQARRRS